MKITKFKVFAYFHVYLFSQYQAMQVKLRIWQYMFIEAAIYWREHAQHKQDSFLNPLKFISQIN